MQHNFEQQKSSNWVIYRQKSFAIKRGFLHFYTYMYFITLLICTYFLYFLLWMCEKWREVSKCFTVEDDFYLIVRACHNVSNRSQSSSLKGNDYKEKKKEIRLSPMTKPLIPTEHSATNWQHKFTTKKLDYTTIADRLRTVVEVTPTVQLWSNKSKSRLIKRTRILNFK